MRWTNGTLDEVNTTSHRNERLKVSFAEQVTNISIVINKSVLNKRPNRIRLYIRIDCKAPFFGRIKLEKMLSPTGRNESVEKGYQFPKNEETAVSLRVWRLKQERRRNEDAIAGDLLTIIPAKKGEELKTTYENIIEQIRIYKLRYVYYKKGAGRKKLRPAPDMTKFLFSVPPYLFAVFLPYVGWRILRNNLLQGRLNFDGQQTKEKRRCDKGDE